MFKEERTIIYRRWCYLFAISFLLGILLMNLCSDLFLGEEGIFNASSMNRLKYFEVENSRFFQYALWKHLKEYFILGLISTTFLGIAAAYFGIALRGMMLGMLITGAIIRYGTKGLLLILAGFFPQQLLLFPASFLMICWCYQNCCSFYFPAKAVWPIYRNKKSQFLRQILILTWIVGVVLIGSILESYVNPILFSDVMKIF